MKQPQNKLGMFGSTPPPVAGNERRKLIIMTVALVMVLGAFIFNQIDSGSSPADRSNLAAVAGTTGTKIKIPELHKQEVSDLVHDGTEIDQLAIEPGLIDLVLNDVARLVPAHFEAMQAETGSLQVIEAIEANPKAVRLKPVRLRGWILAMRDMQRENNKPYKLGTLVLDDGTSVHFAVSNLKDEGLNVGSSVRLDGLFVKLLREDVDGTWLDGPLFAGRDMIRSFAPVFTKTVEYGVGGDDLGTFSANELTHIKNDNIEFGVGKLPFEEKWKLMGRAARLKAGDIDWDQVPILDRDLLHKLLANGDDWKGQPIRLPDDGAALLTSRTRPAGENPARLEILTEGWLMEYEWANDIPAMKFIAPFDIGVGDVKEGEDGPTVMGRGFFFKNLAYPSSAKGLRLSPVLVLSSVKPMAEQEDNSIVYILGLVAFLTIILIGGIFVMLRRDQRKSVEFQQRRSERRKHRQQVPAN